MIDRILLQYDKSSMKAILQIGTYTALGSGSQSNTEITLKHRHSQIPLDTQWSLAEQEQTQTNRKIPAYPA